MFKSTCVFSGNANVPLAEAIVRYLEMPLGRAKIARFSSCG